MFKKLLNTSPFNSSTSGLEGISEQNRMNDNMGYHRRSLTTVESPSPSDGVNAAQTFKVPFVKPNNAIKNSASLCADGHEANERDKQKHRCKS